MSTIITVSRQISELIHDADTDFDAPVKIQTPDGKEYTVTDVNLEVNDDDDSQVVWLSVVEE